MIRLLYFFSKTDLKIIQHCPASTKNINATLGFFVLLTGMMALASGTYAISNMFLHENEITKRPEISFWGILASILLGIIYAAFIMAIDREIVSAGSKWASVLRIPLAVVISIVISVPVEMQILEGRITRHLREKYQAEFDRLDEKTRDKNRVTDISEQIKSIETAQKKAITERDRWADNMEAEVVGRVSPGRTGIPGRGSDYYEARNNKEMQEKQIEKYDSSLVQLKKELNEASSKAKTDFDNSRNAGQYDLLSKYIALHEIEDEDKTKSAKKMSWGITILFCLFELIPSIIKLFIPKTEYEVMLDKRRILNINTANSISDDGYLQHNSMNIDEIMVHNPIVVNKMFKSQAI